MRRCRAFFVCKREGGAFTSAIHSEQAIHPKQFDDEDPKA
jgi:hypothetical protein